MMLPIRVRLPFTEGALIAQFHEQGSIDLIENFQNGVMIQGSIPGRLITRFQNFIDKPTLQETDRPIFPED